MAEQTTGTYAFDPSGSSPENRVTKELHSIQFGGNRPFIIPKAAPFFAGTLKVYNANTGVQYKEGSDYICGHIFREAQESIGRPIYGSIVFVNKTLDSLVGIEYNTLGGKWGCSDQAIAEELAAQNLNPEQRTWGEIEGLPEAFPPIRHEDSMSTVEGFNDLLTRLDAIVVAIKESAVTGGKDYRDLEERINKLQASDVGLGLVSNWAKTTEEQAKIAKDDASYLTPAMAAILVDALVGQALKTHVEDKDNPHKNTADTVKLGLVSNYVIATVPIAEDGKSNSAYMTPYTTMALIKKAVKMDELTTLINDFTVHANDRENPHRVTAAQINAYNKEEINRMLNELTAGDSTRFAGLTAEQWRESLPSKENLVAAVKASQDYADLLVDMSALQPPTLSFDTTQKHVETIERVGHGFIIYLKDGTGITSQDVTLATTDLKDTKVFGSEYDDNYFIIRKGCLSVAGSSTINTPSVFDVVGDGNPGVQKAFQRGDYLIVHCIDNTLYRYQLASLRNDRKAAAETVIKNVQCCYADDDTTDAWFYMTETNAHFVDSHGENKLTFNVGGLTGSILDGIYYGSYFALRCDSSGQDRLCLYKIPTSGDTVAPMYTSDVPKINAYMGLNDEVFAIYTNALGGLKTVPLNGVVENVGYLHIDSFLSKIKAFALNKHQILLYDEVWGLQYLGDTPEIRPIY